MNYLNKEVARLERFKEDKEKMGGSSAKAAKLVHREKETPSWIPEWFPVKAVTDDEYRAQLEAEVRYHKRMADLKDEKLEARRKKVLGE